jgi:hypothetical protein
MILWVDDFTLLGNHLPTIIASKQLLSTIFEMTDLGEISYFLGMRITRDRPNRLLFLDQQKYIHDILERFNMENSKPALTPFATGTKLSASSIPVADQDRDLRSLYQSIVGSLMYTMLATRPDLSFTVSKLAQYMHNPDSTHLNAATHVLRYLRGTASYRLRLGDNTDNIYGYSDSDWGGNIEDRKSTSGICFFLAGGVISWASKKQPTVALSSVEAEYMSLTLAAKQAMWLRIFLQELGLAIPSALTVFTDSQGAQALAKNPVQHARTKHIDIQHHFIRETIENGFLQLDYTPTASMVADILTKALPAPQHQNLTALLGLSA